MKKNLGVLAMGIIIGLLLGASLGVSFAQLPPSAGEEVHLMREMAASLKGIDETLRNRCR